MLVGIYDTAQFKLEARMWVTRVCFVAPAKYFSKSCMSVGNCTTISHAIHACVMSPYMPAYVRACTHTLQCTHANVRNFNRHK